MGDNAVTAVTDNIGVFSCHCQLTFDFFSGAYTRLDEDYTGNEL